MVNSLSKRYKSLLAGALIAAHFATCLLAHLLHFHPGHDHVDVKGEIYHSHAPSTHSDEPEFEHRHHDLQDVLHLLEGSPLIEKMHSLIETHFGQYYYLDKHKPQIEFAGLPSASPPLPKLIGKTILKIPPVHLVRDFIVLVATGLSPPLA